ncbi:hypothetical protein C9890_0100 [Perkinsus sp. BL_2016]|nr:hypothetical protein C9890_0100 [Perkinsus sp. BL_2016]
MLPRHHFHRQPAQTRHTPHFTRHTSHVTRHTSHVTRHTSHVTRHTSHVTQSSPQQLQHITCCPVPLSPPPARRSCSGNVRQTSCMSHVTRHTSHITHHTSHITGHTSHVTSHTSPSLQCMILRHSLRQPPLRQLQDGAHAQQMRIVHVSCL